MPAGVAYHPPSGRSTWNTPQELVTPLLRFGPLDLDPCSNPSSIVPATRRLMLEQGQDGMVAPWAGTVFVNPPFDELRAWAAKAASEAAAGVEVLFLLPSRTDTKAWHDYIAQADAILFWRGRLTFLGGEHPAPFPVSLAYFGVRVGRFLEVFTQHGLVVVPAE